MAESRAANSSNSPDAPRPLPARPRPAPGEAVELGDVESDEAMATRLHREEQTRINARTRDAFYPNQPFDPSPRSTTQATATPSFVMPTPHGHTTSPIFPHRHPHTSPTYPSAPAPQDTTLGRHMMNGEIARNTGTPRGTWTAPTVHRPNEIPMQPMTNVRTPRSPYYPETPTGGTNSGWGSPHGVITGRDATHVDDDEAFARALQAQEEEAGGARMDFQYQPSTKATRRWRLGYRRRRTPVHTCPRVHLAARPRLATRRWPGRFRRRRIERDAAVPRPDRLRRVPRVPQVPSGPRPERAPGASARRPCSRDTSPPWDTSGTAAASSAARVPNPSARVTSRCVKERRTTAGVTRTGSRPSAACAVSSSARRGGGAGSPAGASGS